MDVSANAGRFVAERPHGANDPGVRRCAGFGEAGISESNCGGREAELQREPAVEGVAVWIRDPNPDDARARARVHGSNRDVMADGNAEAGSHDVVAVLARQPEGNTKAVQKATGDRGRIEIRRDGVAGDRRDQNDVTGLGTAGVTSSIARADAEASGRGDHGNHETDRASGQARTRVPVTGRIATSPRTAGQDSSSIETVRRKGRGSPAAAGWRGSGDEVQVWKEIWLQRSGGRRRAEPLDSRGRCGTRPEGK